MKIVSHRQKVNFVLDKKKLFHELRHEGFANMGGLQSFLEKKAGAGITLTTVIIIVFMIIIKRLRSLALATRFCCLFQCFQCLAVFLAVQDS